MEFPQVLASNNSLQQTKPKNLGSLGILAKSVMSGGTPKSPAQPTETNSKVTPTRVSSTHVSYY